MVEVASDGLSAIEKAKSMHFDVVLMDIQMPLMDGYEAVAHLREHGYTVPIIALSAHAMTGEMERSLEVGCQGYLSKPIDRTKVIQKIRDLLA